MNDSADVVHARLEDAFGRLDLRVEAAQNLDDCSGIGGGQRRHAQHILLVQDLDGGGAARLGGEDEGLRLSQPDLGLAPEA
jgi:hypothetical protein